MNLFVETLNDSCSAGCDSCGNPPTPKRETKNDRRACVAMTGHRWPGGLVSFNYHQDLLTLGKDVCHCVPRVLLCLKCAVAYMKEFNRLNAMR